MSRFTIIVIIVFVFGQTCLGRVDSWAERSGVPIVQMGGAIPQNFQSERQVQAVA